MNSRAATRIESPHLRLEWNSEHFRLTFGGLENIVFDRVGRPITWTRKHGSFRRGLDGRVKRILRRGDDETHFHEATLLSSSECHRWKEKVKELLLEAWRSLRHPLLETALELDLEADEAQATKVWSRVGILPPDQYRALVVQLTEGCSYNKCSFCNFYKTQPFRSKTEAEFLSHLRAAVRFLGPAIQRRRGIFLGEANAANLPLARLESALLTLSEQFPSDLRDPSGQPRHPLGFHQVAAFLDTFSVVRDPADWRRLKQAGLQSVYLGIESGCVEVLRLLGKPGHPSRVECLVHHLKQAGLQVHPIVMSGAGGHRLAEQHLHESVHSLKRMPLEKGDQILISEFEVHPGSPYQERAHRLGSESLSRLECRQQTRALTAMLGCKRLRGVRFSLYDVRQFVYA